MKFLNIPVDNPWFLAPMAGVTDSAFRTVCRNENFKVKKY